MLNQLLCDANLEDKLANIHAKLAEIKKALEEDQVSISELAITKQLTKNPEDYADKKSLPHVQVAVRLNQTLTKKFKQGDTVFYVVCEVTYPPIPFSNGILIWNYQPEFLLLGWYYQRSYPKGLSFRRTEKQCEFKNRR